MPWIHGNKPTGAHTCGRMIVEAMRAINEREKAVAKTQTEFYRYIDKYNSHAKSLGTPDGGINIPTLDGIDGTRTYNKYILDLRDAIERMCQPWPANGFWSGDRGEHAAGGWYLWAIPFNWTDGSPQNLYYKVFGTGYTWKRDLTKVTTENEKLNIEDIDIEEILKCIETMGKWLLISQDYSSTLKKHYENISESPEEVWAKMLVSEPGLEGVKANVKCLQYRGGIGWEASVGRSYFSYNTSGLEGKTILEVNSWCWATAFHSPTYGIGRVSQVYKCNFYPQSPPPWDIDLGSLVYEYILPGLSRDEFIVNINTSFIEKNKNTDFTWRIPEDEVFEHYCFGVNSQLYALEIKIDSWNYPDLANPIP